jgi:hypothetical protein
MYRRKPPPLATWMLEHLASGARDEALTGDLLEEFRTGRSDGWYWQQTLFVCIVSWSRSFAARFPALVFAVMWSVLAPVWKAAIDKPSGNLTFDKFFQMFGPFFLPVALAIWMAVHAAFLWIGLLVYQSAHSVLGKSLRRNDLRRAYWLATLILPPLVFVTFVLDNLYQYSIPGLAHARLGATPFAQMTDFGLLPDIIRIPYFIALLAGLWGTIHPSPRRQFTLPSNPIPESIEPFSDTIAVAATRDAVSARRFFALVVAAGFMNTSIASILLCRLPDSSIPALSSLLLRALCYVVLGAAGGVMGAYAYWEGPWSPLRDRPPVPFSLFALVCSSGWVWVPAMIIFSGALSRTAAFVAMISAFALASGLRSASYFALAPASTPSLSAPCGATDLFEESLYREPLDLSGYTIAISLFVAGAALAVQWNFTAGALLALAASVFAWKKTIPRDRSSESRCAYRQALFRVGLVVVPAVIVTAWALLDGVDYRNRTERGGKGLAADGANPALPGPTRPANSPTIAYGSGGYVSVVLWPIPPKKQIIPPVPMSDRFLAPGSSQPLIIHFDGDYTYVQPPDKLPGPGAHRAQGTPLDVAIESNNALPVVMAAHQNLHEVIPIARCREIDLQIQNRDNVQGPVSLALMLTNSSTARSSGFYLGQEPLLSTEPVYFSFKTSPITEMLYFSVPQSSTFKKFSGITVMVLPDIEHRFVAPKIAIKQFQLLPR